jgi:phospholipid/cholesterol/gamma-HCH transport system substrate-binding protein
MPRQLRWPQLLPGILIVAGIALAAAAVLTFGRIGALHGDTVRLYTAVGQAGGVMSGTEVWLDGQKVGLVHSVDFRSVSVDTTHRLLISLDVLESALPHLRRDSRSQIRPGGTLIGTPVVYVSSGTFDSPRLAAGDTIPALPAGDTEALASAAETAARQLPWVLADARTLIAGLRDGRGSAGALMHDGAPDLAATRASASRLIARATRGRGTVTLALRDQALRALVGRVSAQIDSVRTLVADSNATALGRFRRDSTLAHAIADMRAELASVQAALGEARGTAGRVLADSALTRELGRTGAAMDSLMSDIKRRPLRYIRL